MEENKQSIAQAKSPWKMIAIILIVVAVGLATATAFLLLKKDDSTTDADKNTGNSTGTPADGTGTDELSETYTTKTLGVSFSYPKTWTITKETLSSPGILAEVIIKSSSGVEIHFRFDIGNQLGLGGTCDVEAGIHTQLHKEASTGISGLNVVSGVDVSSGNLLVYVSTATTLDKPVNICDIYLDRLIARKINGTSKDDIVEFIAVMESRPSDAEYAELVKILASLKQN